MGVSTDDPGASDISDLQNRLEEGDGVLSIWPSLCIVYRGNAREGTHSASARDDTAMTTPKYTARPHGGGAGGAPTWPPYHGTAQAQRPTTV